MSRQTLIIFIPTNLLMVMIALNFRLMGEWDTLLLSLALVGGTTMNWIVVSISYAEKIKTKKILIFYLVSIGMFGFLTLLGLMGISIGIVGFFILPIVLFGFCLYVLILLVDMRKYLMAINFALVVIVCLQLLNINYALMPELCMILLPILVTIFIVQLIPFIKEMRNG